MATLGIRGVSVTPEEAKDIWERVSSPHNRAWFVKVIQCCLITLVLFYPPGGSGVYGINFAKYEKTTDVVMECCLYLSFVTIGCHSGVCAFSFPSNDMQIQRLVKVHLYFMIVEFALLGGILLIALYDLICLFQGSVHMFLA